MGSILEKGDAPVSLAHIDFSGLWPGLYDDSTRSRPRCSGCGGPASAHHQGRGVGGVCQDASWLVASEQGKVVDIEGPSLPSAGVPRMMPPRASPNSAANPGVTVRNPVMPVSITASI